MSLSAIQEIGEKHREALLWFSDHENQVLPWQVIKDNPNRLATLAKGIYKPAYTDYALSIRQTLNSPYADKELIQRPDGSWVYPYFQENPDPNARDREATNRGLMKCLNDGVPIGVLIQSKLAPGVEYMVLGLGRILKWDNGYFIIEKFDATVRDSQTKDVALDWVEAELETSSSLPANDIREWQIRQVLKRRGQARFRMSLIRAYGGCCSITGCNALDALEAAHIAPYNESINNQVGNGLLLRADLHTLFDLGLIAINPSDFTMLISPKLSNSSYSELRNTKLKLPSNSRDWPNDQALRNHAIWAGLLKG